MKMAGFFSSYNLSGFFYICVLTDSKYWRMKDFYLHQLYKQAFIPYSLAGYIVLSG
jgi:hypothetical protein